ncbi:hypothetical protein BC332_34726 [Capsicum chinense]|nr:hypothetical protein BC332_34726 [Capsicum chinense]
MEIDSKKNKNTSRDKEITGNWGKDTSSTGPRGLLDGEEMPKSIGNLSKDTVTSTGPPGVLDGAEMPKSIGNLSKDTITATGPPGVLDGAEMLENRELKLGSENRIQVDSFAHQTPEDVLRVFMMKEFMGTRYLDDLLVPDHRQQKKV